MCYNIIMRKEFELSDFIEGVVTIQGINCDLVERVKERRKELKWSREELSMRSGVSYGSIRRFEEIGDISLSSLLKIANAFGTLEDFNYLFKDEIVTDLEEYDENGS